MTFLSHLETYLWLIYKLQEPDLFAKPITCICKWASCPQVPGPAGRGSGWEGSAALPHNSCSWGLEILRESQGSTGPDPRVLTLPTSALLRDGQDSCSLSRLSIQPLYSLLSWTSWKPGWGEQERGRKLPSQWRRQDRVSQGTGNIGL